MSTFSIGTWVSNKIANNEYFLVFDYDNVDKLSVVKEIEKLQKQFNLSDAQIFKTNNGFHVYYFYDNSLSAEQIKKIFSASEFVDHHFVSNFETLSKEWLGVVIRTGGKYENNDIIPADNISGREPTLIEKSVGETIRNLVSYQLNNPLIDTKKYKYEVDSVTNEKEANTTVLVVLDESNDPSAVEALKEYKKQNPVSIREQYLNSPHKRVSPFIEKEELEEYLWYEDSKKEPTGVEEFDDDDLEGFSSELKAKQKAELPVQKITIEEIWPKNAMITKAKEKWYSNPFIPRLISAASDGREVWFIKDQKIQKLADELGKKLWVEYKITNFYGKRMIFLNNTAYREKMEKVFYYNVEKTGTLTTPLSFFESVAKIDIKNPDFITHKKEVRHLHDRVGRTKFSNFMKENKLSLITGYDIIYDFDTEDANSTESYDNAKRMRDLLQKMRIPFSLNFSGSKGFHIRIKSHLINEACPEFLSFITENEKNINGVFHKLWEFADKNGIKIDRKLYNWDLRGLIRIEWSVHQSTGSVVKPLKDTEFDELQGMTLQEIQEKYSVDNLLKGNLQQKLQRNEFITRMENDWIFMSWEEMRDSGLYSDIEANGKKAWENARSDYINPVNKELRALSKDNPKEFAEIIEKGEYQGFKVEAPEYINLNNGSNYDYMRKGDVWALREFVLDLIK